MQRGLAPSGHRVYRKINHRVLRLHRSRVLRGSDGAGGAQTLYYYKHEAPDGA